MSLSLTMDFMQFSLFEKFLQEKHCENYYGCDDDMPDAFDAWLEGLQIDDLISYADEAIKYYTAKGLGSIRTEKKAISSRENGKKGGRPKISNNN